jgi:polyphosphate kinase 2 (PPK2 family)
VIWLKGGPGIGQKVGIVLEHLDLAGAGGSFRRGAKQRNPGRSQDREQQDPSPRDQSHCRKEQTGSG